MSNKIQDALKAREEEKKKKEQEAKNNKVTEALKARENAMKSDLSSKASDWQNRLNAEIDAYNKHMSSDAWGTTFYEPARENDINLGKLRDEISGYRKYLGEDKADELLSMLEQMKSSYSLRYSFDSEDAYNSYVEERKAIDAILNSEDFEQYYQQGLNAENPTLYDSKAPVNLFGWKPFGDGETIANKVTFAENNYQTAQDEIGRKIVGGQLTPWLYNDTYKPIEDIYNYMTEDEKKVYNYYIGKGETEKAEEYLNGLQDKFEQRAAGELMQWDNTALELLVAFNTGLEQFGKGIGNLDDLFKGTEGDSTVSRLQYANAQMGVNNDGVWKVANDLATTTGNMLPSILVGSLTGGLGGALTMGASATGNAYSEMRNLGYSANQARAYAGMVGASEAALSYALGGISNLGGKVTNHFIGNAISKVDNAIARVAIKWGGNMVSEGIEEGLQSVLEPIFKSIVTGEKVDVDWGAVAYSALLGSLSAGLLEGVPTIAGEVGTYKQGAEIKNQGTDSVNRLKTLGSTYSADSVAYRLAGKVNDKTGAYTIGRLLNEVGAGLSEQNMADITSALEAKGVTSKDAKTIAKWLNKAVDGGYFNNSQIKALEENEVISQVMKEVIIDQNSTVNQRIQGYNEALYSLVEKTTSKSKGTDASTKESPLNALSNDEVARRIAEATGMDISEVAKTIARGTEARGVNETTSAEENALTDKNSTPVNGKVTVNGKETSVKGIASIEDGEIMLEIEGGEKANLADVEFSSSAEGMLYESVADMGLDAATATAFVKGYDPNEGLSAEEYILGFKEAYRYGEYGFPVQEMSKKGFSASLSEASKSLAYGLGKTNAKYKTEAMQKAVSKASPENKAKLKKTADEGTKTIDEALVDKGLTSRQRTSLKALKEVSKALGVEFRIFESSVGEDGKRIGENGRYDPTTGIMYIDLYAGLKGEGTILFTAAHELTHFIRQWSPEKFKVFADFLLEEYGKKGISVNALVQAQIDKAKRKGRDIDFDTAYEEVVADACESFLADGNAMTKIAELKAKDKSLWQKIKSYLTKLVEKIKKAYEGLSPDSVEGRIVSEMLDSAEKLRDMWTETLLDASENYNSSEFVEVDADTESVSPNMFSERTWTASDYVIHRDQMAEKISKTIGVSVEKAKSYIDDINSIAKMIADDRARLDYEASSFGSAFVSNVEYGGSFDYTTLCKKRRIYTGTFTEIQKRLNDVALSPDDILTIRNLMIEEGIEATCGLCYVEGSRANMGKFAKEFIRLYKRDNPNAWIPNMADVNTPDGVEQMRITHPDAYEQYVYFWNHYGKLNDSDPALFASQQKPKLYEARKEYKGEILEHFKGDLTVAKKNLNGGIRMQSFSDFEIVHLIDTMQVIMDMSTVGLAGQAYTKVPEFAKAFGNTGLKINLSLIAKGVDADGKLIFDDREGMPHETAFELRDKYSKDVGTIIVTFTDAQLLAAMADPRIDYIIPFHRSQWKKGQYGAMGLPKGTKDYTFMQNEKLIKQTYHEYQGRMVKDKASNYMPNEYWDFSKSGKENAEAYLKMCAKNNKRPKFYKLLDYDGNGTYSLKKDGSTDGYWKLLIDFKMYDNDGVGSPQMAVTPTFNMDEANTMLNEYKGGHSKYPVASSVVDKFVDNYNKENGTKYSDRDTTSYAPTFYSYMGKVIDDIKLEKMGTSSILNHLKNRGVKDDEIKWSGIEAFLEGKKSVTKAELQEFVAGSQLEIIEQVSDDEEYTRWGDYKLNGGENYRELVFQMPNSTYSNDAMRTHWGDEGEGILAHARIQDMTTADGKKMLFIEEIQSDWHNEGAKYGYVEDSELARIDALKAIADELFLKVEDYSMDKTGLAGEWDTIGKTAEGARLIREYREAQAEYKKADDSLIRKIPDAPFRDTYHEYVLKRLLRMAAEEGYDSIGWTPAIIQDERWSDGQYHEEGKGKSGFLKGYTVEYDQDMPKFLNKYGKKWGATVGHTTVSDTQVWSMDITEPMEQSVLHEGQVLYSDRGYAPFREVLAKQGLDKLSQKLGNYFPLSASFDATMKADKTPLTMTTVKKDGVLRGNGESAFVAGKNAFRATYGTKTDVHINQMDIDAVLYTDLAKESIVKADNENDKQIILDVIPYVKEILSNSILASVERIDHTDNKRTVLYGYRLYNLYWYKENNKKTLHCLVCTVVQNTEQAEGYIFRDIENVTIDHGLPSKNADMPEPVNDDTYTISQLYRFVKGVKRENGGIKYSKTEKDKYLFRYKKRNDGELYSDRDTESVSNRTLLANALEGVAKNDIEKNKLEQYKSKIALIEAEQKKLTETKAKIKELSFAKGIRDTAQIKSLQDSATRIANRINTYDRQLLNLEASKPLKDVLEREKDKAYKEAEQRGQEAVAKEKRRTLEAEVAHRWEIAELREKMANLRKEMANAVGEERQKKREAIDELRARYTTKMREMMNRHQDSIKRGIEGRNKTELRHKIKNVVSDLDKLLRNPTKEKHIPIGLQLCVAEALDAINMDTMNAGERVAYYNNLIAKSSDPDEIALLTKKRDFFEYRDANFKERITALKNAYAEIKNSDDPLIKNAHDDAIEDLIKNTADEVGNTSLKDMSLDQLESVYKMYKAILATVRNANKMFMEGRQQTVTDNSEAVKNEVKAVGGHKDRVLKLTKFFKKFGWNMLKPVTAMKVIGSKTFETLFNNVRAAEDTWAVDVNEAKHFYDKTSEKHGYKKWDFKERHTFKDRTGAEFSLSLEQMMSLYAYSKRAQADAHLELGGFIFDDSIEITEKKLGIPLKYEVNDANPYRLGKLEVLAIANALTNEQKSFVDEMQAYLSDVMGAKGNEVSLAMYDIKLYNEKNYFPLKTSKYFREFDPEKSGTPKIKNSGFSKKTVPQAGNPIVLANFMDVWASHVNDMSMYHAFVLPLEDFMRVYNYSSTAGGYDSVQQYIHNAYGSQANQYIEKLMDDLNGGARVDPSADIINKGLSLFKKASVFASFSVVVQQPSAIARAMAYINPKYFVTSTPSAINLKKHKALWEEVKKYAPVAVIKEMGYFDTGVGRSTVEWLKGNQTIKDKMDDVLSKAPAIADELCWVHIWEAVKRETATKSKSQIGSEEFLKECGKRFTEVITNTQVYDSVLSRNAMMRSKDTGMKMATAFMAEPITSVNMMVDGIIQGKRGNKKFTASTVGAVSASIILNSILVSLVYAARDDDEDETYTEKYIGSVTSELLDGFNPLTYVPFVKDFWSIAQGYDVERSDMSVISRLWESVEGLFDENKSGWERVADTAGAVSSLFGIPLKNILRDAKGMYNLTKTITSGTTTTTGGIRDSVEDSLKSSIPLWDRLIGSDSKSDNLYDAIVSGDSAYVERLKEGYDDEKEYASAVRKAIRDKYKEGTLSLSEAIDMLVEHGDLDDNEAYWKLKEWDYYIANGNTEDYSKYTEFYEAVKTGRNLKAVIKEHLDHGAEAEDLARQITTYYKPLYKEMTNSERASLKGYLLNAYSLLGYNRVKKSKDIDNWLKD